MPLSIIAFDIALSVCTFFIINWIGKHSASSGYITLSAFVTKDEAPAFNFLYRVLSPSIIIILIASVLYSFGADKYVLNIWIVTFFYYVLRQVYIFGFSRAFLVNWKKELLLFSLSVALSWVIYEYFLQQKSSLLPDVSDLKNQFWILIILFIYSLLNNMDLEQDGSEKRKQKYLKSQYDENRKKYHQLISANSDEILLESYIYAILLYENFNRPKLIRKIERLVFPYLSSSIGPMQVKSTTRISDRESVKLGIEIINEVYRTSMEEGKIKAKEKGKEFNPLNDESQRQWLLYKIASKYNKDDSYVRGVVEMHDSLIENIYPQLSPKQNVINYWEYIAF